MPSSINTMMHSVRGFFRFAHIDGLIPADPAVYARLPKIHHDETRTQGLDRLELIRFLQVAQTITVHHGAMAYLLGINALRASEAAAVRIEDYTESLRGHRVLHLIGKGNKPATMPLTVPVLTTSQDDDRPGAQGQCGMRRVLGRQTLSPVTGVGGVLLHGKAGPADRRLSRGTRRSNPAVARQR
jgi:integrase